MERSQCLVNAIHQIARDKWATLAMPDSLTESVSFVQVVEMECVIPAGDQS